MLLALLSGPQHCESRLRARRRTLHLGDMDGYEATKSIRKMFGQEETRIIAVTALLEEFVAHKLEPAGIDGVFYKPISK